MATTTGYVGTIQAETAGTSRLWFSLTAEQTGDAWIKIGPRRAWFTTDMTSSGDRPVHMAQLTLLLEAMRSGLQVEVQHDGAASFHYFEPQDSFEVTSVRVLRAGLKAKA